MAIAIATIAIIVRGQRWPWYAALALGAIGATGAADAYIGQIDIRNRTRCFRGATPAAAPPQSRGLQALLFQILVAFAPIAAAF